MAVEPGEEFTSEDELKTLLERWIAPRPSRVLDKRIETSFAREFSGADGLSQSVLLPQRREVVSMKFCSRCNEEFADKFSFCPVDGTPLTSMVVDSEEASLTVSKEDPSLTVSRGDSGWTVSESAPPPIVSAASPHEEPPAADPVYAHSSALAQREEYHLTIMDDSGLVQRLSHELKDVAHEYELTWPEFNEDTL